LRIFLTTHVNYLPGMSLRHQIICQSGSQVISKVF